VTAEFPTYNAEEAMHDCLNAAQASYQVIPKGPVDYEKYRGQFRLTEMMLQAAQVHATNVQTEVMRKSFHCKMVCCRG
jgi:hypothetical protein